MTWKARLARVILPYIPDKVDVLFEPRDLWVGVYWNRDTEYVLLVDEDFEVFSMYITFIPMFPIFIQWREWDYQACNEADLEYQERKAQSE